MEEKIFYVYRWIAKDLEEVFYVGKGTGNRCNQIACRNEVFKKYYNNYDCEVEIVEYFEDEQDSFKREAELIEYYHKIGQAKASLDNGGKGGCHFVWTDAMREYQSEYNPMKQVEQRQRMSKNNPMQRPDVAEKVSKKVSRAVIIDEIEYLNAHAAGIAFNVSDTTIRTWCTNGKNPAGIICYYKDGITTKRKTGGHHGSTKIGVYVDNIYYSTLKEAATANNFVYTTFAKHLREGKTEFKGHICKYANQQPSQENNQ